MRWYHTERGKSRRQEIRCIGGGEEGGKSPWSHSSGGLGTGVSLGSQLLAPLWIFSWWSSSQAPSMSFLCSRRWQEESRKEEGGRCQADYSWQMGVIGTKIINMWLLPAFPIHWLAQEESYFFRSFLPFLHPQRRALPCQFHSLDSHHLEWKIDKRVHNQRGRRGSVPLLLEYKGRQQSSGKPSTQAENSFFFFLFFFFFGNSKHS